MCVLIVKKFHYACESQTLVLYKKNKIKNRAAQKLNHFLYNNTNN